MTGFYKFGKFKVIPARMPILSKTPDITGILGKKRPLWRAKGGVLFNQVVPPGRLELPRPHGQQILSLPRLPIPPQRPILR